MEQASELAGKKPLEQIQFSRIYPVMPVCAGKTFAAQSFPLRAVFTSESRLFSG